MKTRGQWDSLDESALLADQAAWELEQMAAWLRAHADAIKNGDGPGVLEIRKAKTFAAPVIKAAAQYL